MDEVIFEESRNGQHELRLDRRLAERRIYPAIDVTLFDAPRRVALQREALPRSGSCARAQRSRSEGREAAGLELLIDKLKSTKSNDEFLAEIARGPRFNSDFLR